jgi:glycosyltransferase involved in cell wall biosynthesis
MGQKIAMLQVADAGPLESLVYMLRECGYDCVIPDDRLRRILRDDLRMDNVHDPKDMTRGMGYDPVHVPTAGPHLMESCDLYVDVKAQRCHDKVVARWPRLQGKILWYRINGSSPEHVVRYAADGSGRVQEDCGNEVDVPCPVLTPDLWYRLDPSRDCDERGRHFSELLAPSSPLREGGADWAGMAYPCWPPFVRAGEYATPRVNDSIGYEAPVCLVHNARGWGYERLFPHLQKMGVRILGAGSPDGLVRHSDVPRLLSRALCLVHPKSSDAPGYALYEALAAACPVVCPGRMVWRCAMHDLYKSGETCLTFDDRDSHDELTPAQAQEDADAIGRHIAALMDRNYNRRVGEAGRSRLRPVSWAQDRDGDALRAWMRRHFG